MAFFFTGGKSMTDSLLRVQDLGKSFGGLMVCDTVRFDVMPGELHALIGPNGAGKTTLLNLITGLLPSDKGALFFKGQDITDLPVARRIRCGMARSFQITSIFLGFSVQENIELAVQAVGGSSYRFWKRAAGCRELYEPARAVIKQVGLSSRADITAVRLAHGEQRLLEIGMALASSPELLLLDEPMAGLGPGSCQNLAAMIRELKGNVTILLVEHDMEAVFSLADRITVLDQGRVVATGTPEQIRKNSVVQEIYLGTACLI
jgi:branched-chain amino acid transport system ATP-binding protein